MSFGCHTPSLLSGWNLSMFQRNVRTPNFSLQEFSTQKIEAVHSSETSINAYNIIRRHPKMMFFILTAILPNCCFTIVNLPDLVSTIFNFLIWSPNWVHSARRPLTGLLYLPRVIVRMENLVE
jgi:hypothetical protein